MGAFDKNLRSLLDERFPKSTESLFAGATFKESGIDSMGVVEFIVELERCFKTPMLNGNELSVDSTLDDARDLLISVGAS
ncbi:acyl carrier protein [Streptomyces sp. M41]|uniref:acyl carrier protein n=1 Tax=Streptomyces sp. M41 TaxID=3059412 RepID=UPI0024C7B04F|nr:acyl-carrier protein (ACP) [Streptomyces sp.]BDC78262.1 acyl carrier protein [Streptomyces viridochromogenes]